MLGVTEVGVWLPQWRDCCLAPVTYSLFEKNIEKGKLTSDNTLFFFVDQSGHFCSDAGLWHTTKETKSRRYKLNQKEFAWLKSISLLFRCSKQVMLTMYRVFSGSDC